MPRQPTRLIPNIPVVLVAPAIRLQMQETGERVKRIVIERTSRHFYNLAVHAEPERSGNRAGAASRRRGAGG